MDYISLGKDNTWLPYTQMKLAPKQLEVEYTRGSTIVLKDGRVLIDGVSSWWSSSHGYNHPKITDAIKKQVDKLPHIMMAGLANDETYKLAYNLAKIAPGDLNKVFFSDSGSTAVEVAMKMAVQYFINKKDFNKNRFVSFENSYHGDTMGCMSLADLSTGMHKKFNKYLPGNYNVTLPQTDDELKDFEEFIIKNKSTIAGVIIEPLVQCAGGMKFHSAKTLKLVFGIVKKYNLLFIADECAVGFYRTGKYFACNHADIVPDIMILGKALTGGFLTMAATITTDEMYNNFLSDDMDNALMHGPTFMGNPLAACAANASIEIFDEVDYAFKVKDMEDLMKFELLELKYNKKVIDVRVLGAIAVIELDTDWKEIFKMREYFVQKNIWLRPFEKVIYIMPALNIDSNHLLKIIAEIKLYLQM